MLPEKAQDELRRASRVPVDKDPNARAKAIDRVLERLRLLYPDHFKDDPDVFDENGADQ
jgi:hypothetical protein